jgi:hypothetical protein
MIAGLSLFTYQKRTVVPLVCYRLQRYSFFCNNVEIIFSHVAGNVYICNVKRKRDDAEHCL